MTFLKGNFKKKRKNTNNSEQNKARVVIYPGTDIKTSLCNTLPWQCQNTHGLGANKGISLPILTVYFKATLPTEQSTKPFLIRYMKYQKHGNNFQ